MTKINEKTKEEIGKPYYQVYMKDSGARHIRFKYVDQKGYILGGLILIETHY